MKMAYKRSEHKTSTVLQFIFRGFIGAFFIALQLFFYYLLFVEVWNIPYITLIALVIALILVTKIYNSDNNISYKLTWTIVVLLFNVAGAIFYISCGNGNNLPKRKNKKIVAYLDEKIPVNTVIDELKEKDPIAYKLVRSLHYNTDGYPLYKNTDNTFFSDGLLQYNDMLEKIRNAKKFIFLEFFIISEGSMFDELMSLLKEKADLNIEVKIIYDAVGCGSILKKKTIKEINKHPKIEMVSYNPLGVNLNLAINYRDHRKILIVDGVYAYTGGMNLSDEYIHRKIRFGFWRDNGMVIEGSACHSYTLLFAQNWYMSTNKMLLIEDYKATTTEKESKGYVLPFGDGPSNRKNPTYDLFVAMISNAQKTIYISTPYFVIDTLFIKAITQAIRSGINVKILIPEISDKKSLFPVTIAHFKKIIEAGGEVYQLSSGFNHAKNIIIDGKYGYIGTSNLDYRSLFLHFECGNLIINTPSVKDMEEDFLDAISKSKIICNEVWRKRPLLGKLKAFILTIVGPLL